MEDTAERVAVVVALLDALDRERGAPEDEGAERVWQALGHPHLRTWAWKPSGQSAYGLSGRVRQMLSRRMGRP